MTDKVSALRRTALFGGLGDIEIALLAGRAVERRLLRDEHLFSAGDESRGLYVVVSGAVRAYRTGADGREQVIHVEREGATFAEVPVFDDGPMPSTVAADEDAVVLFLDKRDVRQLCREHPSIAVAALKVLAARLRRCSDLVATLSLQDVGERLGLFLLAEAAARGTRAGDGIDVELQLTKEQIATRIGTVREVVSRALGRLQRAGLVAVEGRRVSILDEEALRSYCGQDADG